MERPVQPSSENRDEVKVSRSLDRQQWWLRLGVSVITGFLAGRAVTPTTTSVGRIVDAVAVVLLGLVAWYHIMWAMRWRHLSNQWQAVAHKVRDDSIQLLDAAAATIVELKAQQEPWKN